MTELSSVLFELSGYISDNKILSIFKTWSRRTHMASLDVITYSGRNKYKHYPYVLSEREVTNSCSTHIKRLTVVVVDLGLPPHPHPATCSLSLLIRTGRENNIENSCHLLMSLHSLWEQNYTILENYLVKIRWRKQTSKVQINDYAFKIKINNVENQYLFSKHCNTEVE